MIQASVCRLIWVLNSTLVLCSDPTLLRLIDNIIVITTVESWIGTLKHSVYQLFVPFYCSMNEWSSKKELVFNRLAKTVDSKAERDASECSNDRASYDGTREYIHIIQNSYYWQE